MRSIFSSDLLNTKKAIKDYNNLDIHNYLVYHNSNKALNWDANGITFKYNYDEEVYYINGTETTKGKLTFANVYYSKTELPFGFTPGNVVQIICDCEDSRITLEFGSYNTNGALINNSTYLSTNSNAKEYIIPLTAIGFIVRFRLIVNSDDSDTFDNIPVKVKIILKNDIHIHYDSTDFNDITSDGCHMFYGDHPHTNAPDMFKYGLMEVKHFNYYGYGNGNFDVIFQKLYNMYKPISGNCMWVRRYLYTSNSWGEWVNVSDSDTLDKIYNSNYLVKNYLNKVATISKGGLTITYTIDVDSITINFNGEANTNTGCIFRFYTYYTDLPDFATDSKSFYVKYEVSGETSNTYYQIAEYYDSEDNYKYLVSRGKSSQIYNLSENATKMWFVICNKSGVYVNETVKISVLNAVDNNTLYNSINVYNKNNINILKETVGLYNYLIRSSYDDEYDCVYSIGIPWEDLNHVVSLNKIVLIPKDTIIQDTKKAFNSNPIYKDCSDEIPALSIDGNFVGSNHGNPNYIKFTISDHGLTIEDIGTVWTDGTYNYTVVQVFSDCIILGSLDNNDHLIVRSPNLIAKGTQSLVPESTSSIQLRRSSINKQWRIVNDVGQDVSNGGGGNNIIIYEDYDINDQSKGLYYLQNNVGNNTNASYYDDNQPDILCHISNIFTFNRNGTFTAYGTLTAKSNIVNDKVYCTMSKNFSHGGTGYPDYLYVPHSNYKNITQYVGNTDSLNVKTISSEPVHNRYFQLSNNNKGHFMHIMDIGCYDAEARRFLRDSAPSYNSANANKFYNNITGSKQLVPGDMLSWGYGWGPFKTTEDQTVLCWFDVGNGYIVDMDWHNGYDSYCKLPSYMNGMKIEILDKSDTVTIDDRLVTGAGIKIKCTGYGTLSMYIY